MSTRSSTGYLRYMSIISGGLYMRVVFFSNRYSYLQTFDLGTVARSIFSREQLPKSQSLATPQLVSRMFSTFTSWCMMPSPCICCSPTTISRIILKICFSLSLVEPCFYVSTSRSQTVRGQCSMRMQASRQVSLWISWQPKKPTIWEQWASSFMMATSWQYICLCSGLWQISFFMAQLRPVSTSCTKLTNPQPPSAICFTSLSFLPAIRCVDKLVNRSTTYFKQFPIILHAYIYYTARAYTTMNRQLHGISQQVQSEYSEGAEKKKIPSEVIEKYLTVGNGPLLTYLERIAAKLSPFWATSHAQLAANGWSVLTGDWKFDANNHSMYWVFWGPLSLVFFSYLLHSAPFANRLNLSAAGLIDLGLILALGFVMFVFSNVMHSPFDRFVQHVCVSAHLNLLTVLHCVVNVAGPDIMVIPMSCLYVGVCSFLHFRIYNLAVKPTLVEFVVLLLLIVSAYSTAAYLFYVFLFSNGPVPAPSSTQLHHFVVLRDFSI